MTKLLFCATAATLVLGLASCDEDNDQLIDLELNDEQLLVASNTSGKLVKIQTGDLDDPDRVNIDVPYEDGDGIGLRGTDLFSANRSDNKLHLLNDVFDGDREDAVRVEATTDINIPNQRGIAVAREIGGAKVAVASADANTDDDDNDNFIYLFEGERSDLELEATVRVPFQLWGLEWDGDRLIAVMDGTDSVAVFEDFDDASDTEGDNVLQPTFKFKVEGLTRTHGVTFGKDDDILILTDIGAAGSDSDGAVHFVRNWRGAARDAAERNGVLGLDRQVRFAGAATLLGNPVDVAYDDDNNRIFVAERARDGGRLLAFNAPNDDEYGTTINPVPVFNIVVAGASSVEYRD